MNEVCPGRFWEWKEAEAEAELWELPIEAANARPPVAGVTGRWGTMDPGMHPYAFNKVFMFVS